MKKGSGTSRCGPASIRLTSLLMPFLLLAVVGTTFTCMSTCTGGGSKLETVKFARKNVSR